MEFGEAVKICLGKYATFSGRAPRSEYWWFYLFTFIAMTVGGLIDLLLWEKLGWLYGIIGLLLFLPGLTASVRRLHDRDRSGWWLLLGAIPLVGTIILIVWLATRGTVGPNRFGPDPLPAV